MTSKGGLKNKKPYLNREDDEEIIAELEAMTGREYNLHGDNKTTDNNNSEALFFTKTSNNKQTKMKQKKSDKQIKPVVDKIEKDTSHIPFYSSNASVKELQKIVRQAGNSSEDRYKILEARDRLMRYKKVKAHTLDAKVIRGTCPDMCPEKERLMREFQRQVSAYELQENATGDYKICHKTAVKQYSRSSADQEEPMPQDLRPVQSLKMTMSYLLYEITDLCEKEGTNLADWYHFLWDRTRGIRKDITQQELCDLDTVELLEECARFHIVCSERLCSEESSVFDKKINTENLTKCLQTLKYMYNDLRIKGIACKNEPEFRAYIVLLNLNNANFMWDLQRLPSHIQKSPAVKFSIKVYSSIQSNNYTKFFKLVRETTYLNACILLRYFFQVRVAALSVMLKAYCRTTSTEYPLYEFIDILGFDDENEAIYFCEQAGLNISNDELHIILNRQNASLPPPLMDQGRAKSLVEAKRIKSGWSIGQSIAGGLMPDKIYLNHKPHNSFDDQGYLKADSLNASDQFGEELIDDDLDQDEIEDDEEEGEEEEEEEEVEEEEEEGIEEQEMDEEEEYNEYEEEEEEEEQDDVYEFTDETMEEPSSPVKQKTPLFTKKNKPDQSSNVPQQESTTNIFAPSSTFTFARPALPVSAPSFPVTQLKNTTTQSSDQFSFRSASVFLQSTNSSIFSSPSTFISTNSTSQNIFSSTSAPTTASSFNNQQSVFPGFSAATAAASTLKSEPNTFKVPESIVAPKLKIEAKDLEKRIPDDTQKNLENELKQKQIENDAMEIVDELVIDVVHDICSTLLKKELDKIKVYDDLSNKIINDMLDEYILENCKTILDKELQLQKSLQNVEIRMKNRITLKYLKLWCKFVMKKKLQRKALDSTPVWLPKLSLEDCAMSLYRKDQSLVINNMRRKNLKSHHENYAQMKYLIPIEAKIYSGLKENLKILDIESSSVIFWKLLISWPSLENRALLWRYKKIVSQYLCPTDFSIDPILKSYKPNPYETLNICIKQTEGPVDDCHLVGVDGLFIVATSDETAKSITKRVTKLILSRQKLMPVPLVLLIFGEMSLRKSDITTELDSLLQSGYILEYTVHHETTLDEDIVLKLTETTLLWLTQNKSPPVPLEMDHLREIISTCLTDELWLRISGHGSFNSNLADALEDPKFVVDLHNEAVDHLLDIIMDPESLLYTDFPPEFKIFMPQEIELPCSYENFDDTDWKQQDNRQQVEDIISNFSLPHWPFEWPIEDTMQLHKAIIQYCQLILTEANYKTIACNILSNIFFMSDNEAQPKFIHVVLEILKAKVELISLDHRVVYNKNHVKHFRTLPWWFKSTTLINFKTQRCGNERPAEKKQRIDLEQDNKNISRIIEEFDDVFETSESIDKFNCEKYKKSHQNIQSTTDKLDKLLAEQQMANRKFQERLEAALRDNN